MKKPTKTEILAKYGPIYRALAEIRNLRAKIRNGEQEGWEGTARRTVLEKDLENLLGENAPAQ